MHPFARSATAVLVLLALAPTVGAGISLSRVICSVRLAPGISEGYGRSGGLVIATKTAYADCTNNFEPFQVHALCTAAPTHPSCTTDARFHYSEAALLATYEILVKVRHAQDTVDIFFEGTQFTRAQQVRVGRD